MVVTGLGMVSPAGVGVTAGWEAICRGLGTGRREHDPGDGSGLTAEPHVGDGSRAAPPTGPLAADAPAPGSPSRRPRAYVTCRVPGFDADALLGAQRAHRLERFSQFALVAAMEALADAGLDTGDWDGTRVGVVIGNSMGGVPAYSLAHRTLDSTGPHSVSALLLPQFLSNMVAGQVAIAFGATGPCLVVNTACASGATAIGTARDLLLSGRCDIVVTGGTEAALTPVVLSGFAQLGALAAAGGEPAAASRPFDTARDGFVIAEGAGILVLEREEHARARRARVHARLAGYGAAADAHHPVAPHPEGAGLAAAIRAALADAGLGASDVDHVNAHATGTPRGDEVEAATLARLLPHRPLVTSVKGVTGHTLGAAGAIEAVCSVLSVARGTVPPTANLGTADPGNELDIARSVVRRKVDVALTTSVGFGGQNAALAVTAP
ncbi:beta-ketoacyl-[acyl-carrier-protein] synthase family protein [Streptomyces sp. NPDC058657]|uniref:beta-ketoacyl-[acyl-carrier-protein] synthase family protein n=1 Tax=unclassified Streptomyces TaxID=2593676 RepID=UPI0036641546